MSVIQKETIRYCKTCYEARKERDFEIDVVVPDSEADVYEVLLADEQVNVTECLLANGKVHVEGKCIVNVLCLTESGGRPVHISHAFDFDQIFDADSIRNEAKVSLSCEKTQLTCRILNSRKVGIRAAVEITVRIKDNAEVEIFAGGEEFETLVNESKQLYLVGTDERVVRVNEDVEIGASQPQIERILFTSARTYCADRKVINNRIIAKGIVEARTYYLAQDGTLGLNVSEIPFNHIFSVDGVDDEAYCVVGMRVKNAVASAYGNTDGETRVISLETELNCTAWAYQEKTANICVDAFSILDDTTVEKATMSFSRRPCDTMVSATVKDTVKCNFTIQSIENMSAEIAGLNFAEKDGISVAEGEAIFTVLATAEGGILQCIEAKIPFEIPTEFPCGSECEVLERNAVVTAVGYTPNGVDSTEVRCNVSVNVQYCVIKEEDMVLTLCSCGERTRNDGLILYFPEENESLWEIAKKYGVKLESLRSANELSGDKITERMVMIPTA